MATSSFEHAIVAKSRLISRIEDRRAAAVAGIRRIQNALIKVHLAASGYNDMKFKGYMAFQGVPAMNCRLGMRGTRSWSESGLSVKSFRLRSLRSCARDLAALPIASVWDYQCRRGFCEMSRCAANLHRVPTNSEEEEAFHRTAGRGVRVIPGSGQSGDEILVIGDGPTRHLCAQVLARTERKGPRWANMKIRNCSKTGVSTALLTTGNRAYTLLRSKPPAASGWSWRERRAPRHSGSQEHIAGLISRLAPI